jgi:hypothetical protein
MRRFRGGRWVGGWLLLALLVGARAAASPVAGWGIDACLTTHVTPVEVPGYISLLRGSGVSWLRERELATEGVPGPGTPAHRERFRALKAAGFRVAAFASLPAPQQGKSGAPHEDDLRLVYQHAKTLATTSADLVDAWEMVGEPDLGFYLELPDRLAAYQKALYLGLKAGAAERAAGEPRPLVLMGALGMPPSPWLQRAARNDLLAYTDALNFHYYGHAEHFAGVIRAFRAALAGFAGAGYAPERLPFWVTECGIDAVKPEDFLGAERRQIQADFVRRTAEAARAAPEVAVFMPFIFVHQRDPYAMTVDGKPLPAWAEYAELTRQTAWPVDRPLAREPHQPSPLVVQWLPDETTTRPQKVAGTYRFVGDSAITGRLKVYNFAAVLAECRLGAESLEEVAVVGLPTGPFVVPPGEVREFPVQLRRETVGRAFRTEWRVTVSSPVGIGRAAIGLASGFDAAHYREIDLWLRAPTGGVPRFLPKRYFPGATVGPWSLMNGLEARATEAGYAFHVAQLNHDPLTPTLAVAEVDGLPAAGIVWARFDRPLDRERQARVILVDDEGRRFTIWENFGADYFGSPAELKLDLRDFHPYAWGKVDENHVLRPERIREIQVRFYFRRTEAPLAVRLSFLAPRATP